MDTEISRSRDPRQAAEHLVAVVPRLMRLIGAEAAACNAGGALTVTQLGVLSAVKRGRSLPSEIARELRITPATATGAVDVLVRRGMLERGNHPGDRRRIPVRLTRAGHGYLHAAHERAVSALARLLARIEASDLGVLERNLDLLLQFLIEEVAVPSSYKS